MVWLGLLSAVMHAGWNAMLKREPDARAASVVIIAGAAAISAVLALTVGPAQVPVEAWPAIAIVGAVEGVYFVTLAGAMGRLPLQTAYGVSRGLGLLLVWPLSIWLQAETVTTARLAGAGVLSLGLFALIEGGGSRAGMVYAVLAAVSIAAYPIAYKDALARGVAPFSLFALSLSIGLPAALIPLGKQAARRIRAALRPRLAFAAVICSASFLVFLLALKGMGAAHLTAVRNTSVLFASIFAWMMGEPRTPRAIAAAVLMTLGAVLVGL